ncbi:MAG: NUDIX hydrolase [Cyclobacteriaceae bacterium]
MINRDDFSEALAAYKPLDSREAGFVPRFKELLRYPNCYERSLLSGHLTASCWVLNHDHSQVLMLHHAKLNKWLQPGGHADGDENLLRVAQKELDEETGLTDYELISESIFDLDIHDIPERKGVPPHQHYDVRFAFRASLSSSITKNHESNALEWVDLAKVPDEPSLQRMVTKTSQLP